MLCYVTTSSLSCTRSLTHFVSRKQLNRCVVRGVMSHVHKDMLQPAGHQPPMVEQPVLKSGTAVWQTVCHFLRVAEQW